MSRLTKAEIESCIEHANWVMGHTGTSTDQHTQASTEKTLAEMALACLEYEGTISWNVTCTNCASLLDKNYEQYAKLDQILRILDSVEGGVESSTGAVMRIQDVMAS